MNRYQLILSRAEIQMMTLPQVEEKLKTTCPGNYSIIDKYNPNRMLFEYDVKFENPHEEILWKLKYS